ncbi:UDP-2,4-diacetamido-2,4,6-trideoxy-beta-L-altropyranose hydrolase [Geobacillus subterraneus]|uniref:UDP-2,4-diacetamido-2,4, 6-trideoxy-beta-L-altropyranose hydrolase n=1 Tax=Geobacillus subterraneus TaxID=129338 RepID=UPI002AC91FC5|nr:UDP-2,4-diacetamido-2,4,6-trideoxy-beta-L-altropyranose hydrolase [Geobacillus subterraneus]WPZ18073.1 UDP-2,4-diacetamido-2,4,6-trideoxy-beta-L-altropyranose hydrolase [Geobacillus subterraneus]
MNILFRVDSSFVIGTGHVMRCLTLARMLKEAGCAVYFAMRVGVGDLCDEVESRGFPVFRLTYDGPLSQEMDAQWTIDVVRGFPQPIDWCIVDHYELDRRWEENVKGYVRRVMVIDDLANRPHECDILLDQNYYRQAQQRYHGLVPSSCRLFLGPKYLLLRPEFEEARQSAPIRNGQVRRLLLFFGGSDPTNETEKALHALKELDICHLEVDVVVGRANLNRHRIESLCRERGFHYYCQINYLAELMAKADFSLGAGGAAMWERCFLGLPSAVTVVSENQRQSTEDAAAYGSVWNVGWHADVKSGEYSDIIYRAMASSEQLKRMSSKAFELVGSIREYTVHPVVQALLEG